MLDKSEWTRFSIPVFNIPRSGGLDPSFAPTLLCWSRDSAYLAVSVGDKFGLTVLKVTSTGASETSKYASRYKIRGISSSAKFGLNDVLSSFDDNLKLSLLHWPSAVSNAKDSKGNLTVSPHCYYKRCEDFILLYQSLGDYLNKVTGKKEVRSVTSLIVKLTQESQAWFATGGATTAGMYAS